MNCLDSETCFDRRYALGFGLAIVLWAVTIVTSMLL
jgi:hypothetical protein